MSPTQQLAQEAWLIVTFRHGSLESKETAQTWMYVPEGPACETEGFPAMVLSCYGDVSVSEGLCQLCPSGNDWEAGAGPSSLETPF